MFSRSTFFSETNSKLAHLQYLYREAAILKRNLDRNLGILRKKVQPFGRAKNNEQLALTFAGPEWKIATVKASYKHRPIGTNS